MSMQWNPKDLLGCWPVQQNEHMTISYPDGTAVEALLLARGDDTLRVIIPGDDDVRTFTLISGTWVSEDCGQVKIEFAWQRGGKTDVPREVDCICSKELASRLTSMLLVGTAQDDLIEKMLYVSSAEGHRVRIQQSQLNIGDVNHLRGELRWASASGLPN